MKVGVLLSAGASTRMGSAKALVKLKGESFAAAGIRTLWSVCDSVIVVLGHDAKRIQKSIEAEFVKLVESGKLHRDIQGAHKHGAEGLEVHFVTNRAWKKGMYSSVRLGLVGAVSLKPESVVVLPVDHPNVKVNTVRALGAGMDAALGAYKGSRADKKRFAYAIVPRYRGERGHPLVLTPGLALAIAGDRGAAHLADAVRRNARLVGYLDVADKGVVRNRNTR
ncbi:MAG: NTP transferase domain-containing protein [Candidatus Eisenbacteria bacterium]|uniref:NTP transferase domain-containing protein n=1 Tax=Eiseniibacteriota bacterium TaxID=2212470 RepID=A0A849SLA6_UNCEI|nr:NTP transferase domain-containing protein [Candidatus Eisenbacteria bacterium]